MSSTPRSVHAAGPSAVSATRAPSPLVIALILGLVLAPGAGAAPAPAHVGPANATGIRNFGCVTPMLYRGGDFVPHGVQSLTDLGVRTVISLRSHSRHGEPDSCASRGIAYYLFPMNSNASPSPTAMDSILDIVRSAKAPVYVHCTAGELRTGTVCALYRIRVQGWSPQRAWAEQETYGFGPAAHHPSLVHFVYGDSFPLTP